MVSGLRSRFSLFGPAPDRATKEQPSLLDLFPAHFRPRPSVPEICHPLEHASFLLVGNSRALFQRISKVIFRLTHCNNSLKWVSGLDFSLIAELQPKPFLVFIDEKLYMKTEVKDQLNNLGLPLAIIFSKEQASSRLLALPSEIIDCISLSDLTERSMARTLRFATIWQNNHKHTINPKNLPNGQPHCAHNALRRYCTELRNIIRQLPSPLWLCDRDLFLHPCSSNATGDQAQRSLEKLPLQSLPLSKEDLRSLETSAQNALKGFETQSIINSSSACYCFTFRPLYNTKKQITAAIISATELPKEIIQQHAK